MMWEEEKLKLYEQLDDKVVIIMMMMMMMVISTR